MDHFAVFDDFLETEARLGAEVPVEGPAAINPSEFIPVDAEYISSNSSSYSWCVIA